MADVNTFRDFVHLLESDLQVPSTPANDEFFTAWQRAEGNPGINQFNPYNIMGATVGAPAGSYGVARFKNWVDGAAQTASYILRNAKPGGMYAGFYGDLRSGQDAFATATALGNSPWASGHYGGAGASIKRVLTTNPSPDFAVTGAGAQGGTDVRLAGFGDAAKAAAGAVAGALQPGASAVGGAAGGFLSGTLEKALVFSVLLAGGVGLILLGAKRASDPMMPHVDPSTIPAVAAA